MENINVVTQLIVQLLSGGTPEFGARLKQRLNALLIGQGLSPFDEKSYGHKKFSDFLISVFGENVSIERPEGAGDIQVSLRRQQPLQSSQNVNKAQSDAGQSRVIRSDIWQAFTNPDSLRKRFFQRETRAIRHFVQGEPNPAQEEVEREPGRFIEIDRIDGQVQVAWMRSFLDSLRLSPGERNPLEALITDTYSSGLNATFARALGAYGDSWRQFRTNNVTAMISAWAEKHEVPFGDLCVQKNLKNSPSIQADVAQIPLTPRQQATKLLELLTEEDIARLVIPTLLSTIMVKSRL